MVYLINTFFLQFDDIAIFYSERIPKVKGNPFNLNLNPSLYNQPFTPPPRPCSNLKILYAPARPALNQVSINPLMESMECIGLMKKRK